MDPTHPWLFASRSQTLQYRKMKRPIHLFVVFQRFSIYLCSELAQVAVLCVQPCCQLQHLHIITVASDETNHFPNTVVITVVFTPIESNVISWAVQCACMTNFEKLFSLIQVPEQLAIQQRILPAKVILLFNWLPHFFPLNQRWF